MITGSMNCRHAVRTILADDAATNLGGICKVSCNGSLASSTKTRHVCTRDWRRTVRLRSEFRRGHVVVMLGPKSASACSINARSFSFLVMFHGHVLVCFVHSVDDREKLWLARTISTTIPRRCSISCCFLFHDSCFVFSCFWNLVS